jgi:hypothetical protein
MKITKEAEFHLNTAILLMKGIQESMEVKPDQWGCIPREHSPASIKRRCVQIRQELLQVEKGVSAY